jgi:hypothetical protein
MIEALIAGERDPHVLAELAKGRMRSKRPALVQVTRPGFHAHSVTCVLGSIEVTRDGAVGLTRGDEPYAG